VKISTIIIAKNEASNLKKILPRLHWCDDIVLIDDNSTDETANVATQFNVRVFKRSFDGFGPQKQFAVAQTLNEWVLNIDADEYLSNGLAENIHSILDMNKGLVDVIALPRINTVEGLTESHIQKWRWNVNEKGWVNFPDLQPRILQNSPKTIFSLLLFFLL
jgi:glycosyltransferase involved in cell wall biosynthesis